MSDILNWTGYWTTEAPLSPEQVEEDMVLLRAVAFPTSVTVQTAEVYVNGRLWHWERMGAVFGDLRREPVEESSDV